MNVIVLSGRLTDMPETKISQSGKYYTRFSIAVNYWEGGEKRTDFFNCTTFGKQAEFIGRYGDKGLQVLARGSIHLQKTLDKTGNPKIYPSVIVSELDLVGYKQTARGENPPEW